ncbi:MAG: tRNA (guanosine(37)-N1)-methyltransferase TrmD [Lachnospiraceae bacterium]|nr:tRNA (guanosine(37)-N1)-methyltransferase TrmD [Lachnospiraceae bacterium]
MEFVCMTLFPEMIEQAMNTSIIKRAMEKELIALKTVDIRAYTDNKHGRVDDYTYGGGAGMLMQAQPVYDAYQAVREKLQEKPHRVIYVTPQGKMFTQQDAEQLSKEENLVFLCGHYEGIDERVLEEIVTDYYSIGDYILTGGELPALVMMDAVARLVPGVLNNDESAMTESFTDGLLEYPQYSRPEEWRGKKVPEVLLSGHHAKIEQWRMEQAIRRTKERRPDLYEKKFGDGAVDKKGKDRK